MAETLAAEQADEPRALAGARRPLDHLATFRVTYVSIFAFMALYVASVQVGGALLQEHFETRVRSAVSVSPVDGPIGAQINNRVSELLETSPWIQLLGVRVKVTVLSANGDRPLYLGGRVVRAPPPAANLEQAMREALEVLPAISDVSVSVPPASLLSTGVFVVYAAVLLQGLFLYNRAQSRREAERLAAAVTARDTAADRAGSIEQELTTVRSRLRELEPAEGIHAEEIRGLEREREGLRTKLRELAEREAVLRTRADRAGDLEQERTALEELLDEAVEDLSQKEQEIQELQDRLKDAPAAAKKSGKAAKARAREDERLAKRLATLYKNVDVEEHAIADLAGLGDESLKLRAEEGIKRLADDPETAAVRRKVGGLPPQLAIYELGFAGKGRIYYSRSDTGRYRILAIGGKASQKADLEYLSRL
jgi:predicted nuclease with TOPRIM domain